MSHPDKVLRSGIAAALAALLTLALPAAASANLVDDLLNGVNDTVNGILEPGAGGGAGAGAQPTPQPGAATEPEPAAGTPPEYTPPAHGANQHGQGSGAVVDLTPSDALPLPYETGGGSEDVVVGGSRGEIAGGDYHGHVTILALLGQELIEGADTAEGQSSDGPLGDLNAILGDVCTGSGLCLSALAVASDTGPTNSSNSFSVAQANLSPGGVPLLDLGAVESTGQIGEGAGCRSAIGTGRVADANVANLVTANVIDSSSESGACTDGSTSQTNGSSVVGLGGTGLPLPAPGCDNGTADTVLEIPLVLALVCNADDSSGSGGVQLQSPYGVREGLTAFVLGDVVKATTAPSESRTRAPDDGGNDGDDDGDNDGNNEGNNNGNNDGNNDGDDDRDGDGIPDADDSCPAVPGPASNDGCPLGLDTDGDGIPDADDACPTIPGPAANDGCPYGGGPSGKGPDNLAFTGADVASLGLIGLLVGGAGLALMALADRRRRTGRTQA